MRETVLRLHGEATAAQSSRRWWAWRLEHGTIMGGHVAWGSGVHAQSLAAHGPWHGGKDVAVLGEVGGGALCGTSRKRKE